MARDWSWAAPGNGARRALVASTLRPAQEEAIGRREESLTLGRTGPAAFLVRVVSGPAETSTSPVLQLVLGVLVAVALLPLPTPVGSLYLAVPVLAVVAAFSILRGLAEKRFQLHPVAVCVLALIFLSVTHLAVQARLPDERERDFLIAISLIAAFGIIFPRLTTSRRVGEQIYIVAACVIAAAVWMELFLGFRWVAEAEQGFVTEDIPRVLGPLAPGATSTLLLVGGFLALTRRAYLAVLLQFGAMLVLGTRSHLIAAAIVVAMVAFSGRRPVRTLVVVLLGILAAAVWSATAPFFERGVGFLAGDDTRIVLWHAAAERLTSSTVAVAGVGPGGFVQHLRSIDYFYPHSQYLSVALFFGVQGILAFAFLVWYLARQALSHRFLPLLVALLAACAFGEFMIGTTARLTLGAIGFWYLALAPAEASEQANRGAA